MAEYDEHLFNPEIGAFISPPSTSLIRRAEKLKASEARLPKCGGYLLRLKEKVESRPVRMALLPVAVVELILEAPTTYFAWLIHSDLTKKRFVHQLTKEFPHVAGDNPNSLWPMQHDLDSYVDAVNEYSAGSTLTDETISQPPDSDIASLEASTAIEQPVLRQAPIPETGFPSIHQYF